jgi:WD40 repeat protein
MKQFYSIYNILHFGNQLNDSHNRKSPKNQSLPTVQHAFSKNRLSVFLSSDLTDTVKEKSMLYDKILPSLEKKALENDLEILIYDGTAATGNMDHLSWEISRESIKQCSSDSDGLILLSLQSEKYGVILLPKYLEKKTFENALHNKNNSKITPEIIELAQKWYHLDENNFHPRYELRSCSSREEKEEFVPSVLPVLRDCLLDSVPFEKLPNLIKPPSKPTSYLLPDDDDDEIEEFLNIGRSLTEWQSLYALNLKKGENYCWIRRHFNIEEIKELAKSHSELLETLSDTLHDSSKQLKLKLLLSKMESSLLVSSSSPHPASGVSKPPVSSPPSSNAASSSSVPAKKILELSTVLSPSSYLGLTSSENCDAYLKEFETILSTYLHKELDKLIEKKVAFQLFVESKLCISLNVFNEILFHSKIAYEKGNTFYEKEDLISEALSFINQPFKAANIEGGDSAVSLYGSISLVVTGGSGSGKSSFMSILASRLEASAIASSAAVAAAASAVSPIHSPGLLSPTASQPGSRVTSPSAEQSKEGKKRRMSTGTAVTHSSPTLPPNSSANQPSNQAASNSNNSSGTNSRRRSSLTPAANKIAQQSGLPTSPPVILRFCGSSKHCNDGISLLQHIILQIYLLYNELEKIKLFVSQYMTLITPDYWKIVEIFHSVMSEFPIYLFLDSIDLLSNSYEERSQLSFLKGLKLHRDSRIVISYASPLLVSAESANTSLLFEKYLQEAKIPSIILTKLLEEDELVKKGDKETKNISDSKLSHFLKGLLLKRKKRTLSSAQWSVVLNALKSESSLLYYNLAIEVISQWHSYDVSSSLSLAFSVKGLISQILDSFEQEYGKEFISMVFGFLTFSVEGISDLEMQNLLTIAVSYFSHSPTSIASGETKENTESASSKPLQMWLKLKLFLKPYLIEKAENHCFSWKYPQMKEVSTERYQDLNSKIHEILGKYFGNLLEPSFLESHHLQSQGLSLNDVPIWFSSSKINLRRCIEASTHLIEGKLYNEAIYEMCSFENICISLLNGYGYHTLNLLSRLMACYQSNLYASYDKILATKVKDYYHWLRKEMNNILQNPRVETISRASANEQQFPTVKADVNNFMERHTTAFHSTGFTHKSAQSTQWIKQLTLSSAVWTNQSFLMSLKGFSSIYAVVWYVGAMLIATGSEEKVIKIYNLTTGEVIQSLSGHDDAVYALIWLKCRENDSSSNRLVSGSKDKTIKIFNVVTGEVLQTLIGHKSPVNCLALNSQQTQLASGSTDKSIKIWDFLSFTQVASFETELGPIKAISWNIEGTQLASVGAYDKNIKIWDLSKLGKEEGNGDPVSVGNTLAGHKLDVYCVAWSWDHKYLASGSFDKSVKIWNPLASGEKMLCSLAGHYDHVVSLAWNPCSSFFSTTSSNSVAILASASWGKDIRIWNISGSTGSLLLSLVSHIQRINSISWDSTGHFLASASEDTTVKIWDIPSILAPPSSSTSPSTSDWNTTPASTIVQDNYSGSVNWVSWSHNHKYIAVVSNEIRIFDSNTLKLLSIFGKSSDFPLLFCQWNIEDTMLAICSSVFFSLYDMTPKDNVPIGSGTLIRTFAGGINICWNCNGHLIASGSPSDNKLKIWKIDDGGIQSILTTPVKYLTFHPIDENILAVCDKNITLWNTKTSSLLITLEHSHHQTTCLAFNPKGTILASVSADFTIKLWNHQLGTIIHTLTGHSDVISSICWNQDGSLIASSSFDKSIRIWETESNPSITTSVTGHLLQTLEKAHNESITSLSWRNDDKCFVSSSSDGIVKLWESFGAFCLLFFEVFLLFLLFPFCTFSSFSLYLRIYS